jgi:hypothetical protein
VRRLPAALAVLRGHVVGRPESGPGVSTEPDEALALSAQHLEIESRQEDGAWILRLGDGEQTVDITAEIGDPRLAADRLEELARVAARHAAHVRLRSRVRQLRP